MRPPGTPAELERRRRQAVERYAAGDSPTTIARILGVDRGSVHRWSRLAAAPAGASPPTIARIPGVARGSVPRGSRLAAPPGGLAAKPHPGPKPLLSDDQLRQLGALLLQGAGRHGWPNQLWTAARVAALIRRH